MGDDVTSSKEQFEDEQSPILLLFKFNNIYPWKFELYKISKNMYLNHYVKYAALIHLFM